MKFRILPCVGLALLAAACNALSAVRTWTGAMNNDWYDPANWSPSGVPDPADTLNLASGSPLISPPFTLTGQMNWTGGSWTGGLTIGNGGILDWQGGELSAAGTLTVAAGAVVNLSGSGEKVIVGGLTNRGTIHWLDGGLVLYYQAGVPNTQGQIWNEPGGVIDIQCDQSLTSQAGFIGPLHNAGLLRKRASAGNSYMQAVVDNSGTIEAQTGRLDFRSGFSNNASATLSFSLGGTAPGIDYGHISILTPLARNGTVAVSTRNGFLPSPGDTFQVLSYPSATGDISCFTGLDLGGGIMLVPQSTRTSLTLVTATYDVTATEPRLFIALSPGGVRITWPLGFPERDWELQSSPTLFPPDWTPVSAQCGNQALVPATLPQQYFRLRKAQ